jgi:hypothetical protein
MRMKTLPLLLLFAELPLAASERYENAKLNFAATAPGADWKWSTAKDDMSDGVVNVTGPDGDRFSITVSPRGYYRLTDQWVADLRRDITLSSHEQGFEVRDFHVEHAAAPLAQSFAFSYVRVAANGDRQYFEGFVGASSRIYTVQYASYDHDLVPEFRKFVASLQVVDRLEVARAGGSRGDNGSLFGGSAPRTPSFTTPPAASTPSLGLPLGPNGNKTGRH